MRDYHDDSDKDSSDDSDTTMSEKGDLLTTNALQSPRSMALKGTKSLAPFLEQAKEDATATRDAPFASRVKDMSPHLSILTMGGLKEFGIRSYALKKEWILMPDLGHDYSSTRLLRLGQVLLSPNNFDDFAWKESFRDFRPPDAEVQRSCQRDLRFVLTTHPMLLGATSEYESILLEAEDLNTETWQPPQTFMDECMRDSEIGKRFRPIQRCYIVSGLMVASRLKVSRTTRARVGMDLQSLADMRVGDGDKTSTSERIVENVIVAYSLVVIKRSWMGNTVSSIYVKGALM